MTAGWLISTIAFPGVIAHEFGHMIFCRIFNVRIRKVCYFRFGNPAGYVIHDAPDNFSQAFFIDIGPFIISNILAILAFVFAISPSDNMENEGFIFAWLGISFAIHSFPSNADAKALWSATKRHSRKNILLMLVGLPFVLLIYVVNSLRFIQFDLIWAVILFGSVYLTMRNYLLQ